MASGNSPSRALTSLRGLPVKSQPGEDEHGNGPVRREHHQVEVDGDHSDYWREPRPESMNCEQRLTLALPLGLCLPQGHKHSQQGSHDRLTSSPHHMPACPEPQHLPAVWESSRMAFSEFGFWWPHRRPTSTNVFIPILAFQICSGTSCLQS